MARKAAPIHQRVMVTGAVANPGSYEVIGPRTLLEMLGKAGGVTEEAAEYPGITASGYGHYKLIFCNRGSGPS